MAVALEIIPFSNSLDMYGDPDRNAAYSLSGQINITLSPSTSLFERRRPVNLLIQSLVITFEGQTELISEETGYSALRLCSISQELVSDDWIELNNEESEDLAKPCTWSVVFNLTVPGWLPESSAFGDRDGGTNYALHASATIHSNDAQSRAWLSTLCSPFQQVSRLLKAERVVIALIRYTAPSTYASGSDSPFPLSRYEVEAQLDAVHGETAFPREVLSKIRVQMSIPECVGAEDEHIPFSVRLRTNGLPEAQCRRLRVDEFQVDVEQSERYRTRPNSAYMSQFPVPAKEHQPPCRPLLHPHPLSSLYNMGLTATQQNSLLSRSFSVIPPDATGHYKIAGSGYIFAQDAETELDSTWFSLSSKIPLASSQTYTSDWKTCRTVRTSSQSPFLSVGHRMYVTLSCTYDVAGADASPKRVTERLRFHVPLKFVNVPYGSPHGSRSSTPALVAHTRTSSSSSNGSVDSLVDLLLLSTPYASALPAYSQLYYSNGDRKIDYSIPLPLYTPRVQPKNAADTRGN